MVVIVAATGNSHESRIEVGLGQHFVHEPSEDGLVFFCSMSIPLRTMKDLAHPPSASIMRRFSELWCDIRTVKRGVQPKYAPDGIDTVDTAT